MRRLNSVILLMILMACSSSPERTRWDSGKEKMQTYNEEAKFQNEESMGDQLPEAGLGGDNAQPF